MNTKSLKAPERRLKLTKRQREIIIGKLLGDGRLETQNQGRTYRLKIEQSIQSQEYVDWLYREFKDWVQTPPQIEEENYWFNTLSHGSFRFYGQQFYRNGEKVVPKLIHHWLTPLTLAVWFMDDGLVKSEKHQTRIIDTQKFSRKEVERLIRVLKDKFEIRAELKKQKGIYQIMILAESAGQFVGIIEPFIHRSMCFKLKD